MAVESLQRAIEIRAAVAERSPCASGVLKFIEIEAVYQNPFFGLVELLNLGAELGLSGMNNRQLLGVCETVGGVQSLQLRAR